MASANKPTPDGRAAALDAAPSLTPEQMADAFLSQYKPDWQDRAFYLREHLIAFAHGLQLAPSDGGEVSRPHPSEKASSTQAAALRGLAAELRERAHTDAKYGVMQAMTSDREYYGTVNAALVMIEIADRLDALAAQEQP